MSTPCSTPKTKAGNVIPLRCPPPLRAACRRPDPGNPSINDEHYPPRRDHYGERNPRASSREEAAFLALGPGAASWLVEAAAAGIRRIRPKMAEAVTLAKLHPRAEVDRALGMAAIAGRFADNDLIAILSHHLGRRAAQPTRGGEGHSLSWEHRHGHSLACPPRSPKRIPHECCSVACQRF